MFFYSLFFVLICGYTTFWRLLAILFLYQLLFQVCLLLFLPCAPNRSGPCIYFPSFSRQIYPCLLIRPSIFLSPLFPLFYAILRIAFLFTPAPLGPSGMSLHILIFSCTSGRSAFFKFCLSCFLGSPFWSSVGPFWTHFLIGGFMNVVISVVYSSCGYLLGKSLKRRIAP